MEAEKVYNKLNELNIQFKVINHPAMFTCEDAEKYGVKFADNVCDCKNLFLRNKNKSKFYLVSLPLDKKANLKELEGKLKESKLSFGSEELLQEKLNIKSGSVSILNIIGIEKTDVKFVIDLSILKEEKVGFHPNDNTATAIFSPKDLEKILQYYNAEYEFIEI